MPGAANVKIKWTRAGGGGTAPIITSPAFLVTGTVGSLYPTTYFYASGTSPITWSITSGTLPTGMAFSSAGVLSGTPTATASGSITFTATNAYGSANVSLALTVNAAGSSTAAVPTDYVTTALTATGSGTTYNVYNDTDMDNVPWGALGRGDVVNIYWKSTPYARKWGMGRNIANTGTAANPIVVNGVTDASGNRPRFNFNGATTATGSNPSLLAGPYFGNTAYDMYQVGNIYNLEDYAGILIRGFYRSSPEYIQIKNLEIYGARGSFTNLSGATQNYITATSGIRYQNGNDVLIENCIIKDCGWGVYTQTSGPTILDTINRFTLRNSFLTGNGVVGASTEHNAYIQCTNPVIEGNYFGPLVVGALGSSYKSRASGEIFRYNWVETNARAIDFVEPEDQESGTVGLCDQVDYGIDHVYGNVIAVDDDQMKSGNEVYHPFHFGSDKDYTSGFNPVYLASGTTLASRNANWVGGVDVVAFNPSGSAGLWEAATANTLTRAYYVHPTSSPGVLDKQPDNEQSSFAVWAPGVYSGGTVRKVFVQYSTFPARDGYEAELTSTTLTLRRNGSAVGTPYTHGLANLSTTQYVLVGLELSPGVSGSVDVSVRLSSNDRADGFKAPVRVTYNDTSPLTGGHSGVLFNDGGTKSNVRFSTVQPSMGLHKFVFDSDGLVDILDGGYRQLLAPFSSLSTVPGKYVGSTINGKPINRRQLYFYNNTYVCNTVQNQVFFELNESTSRVDLWNNLFWVSKRGSSAYNSGAFKINERGGVFNFANSNILYATSGSKITAGFPADATSGYYTHPSTYSITGRTLPANLNDPITLDADPLLTAVSAPTYNYLPTASFATTGGATTFPSGLPASFKSLPVQFQPVKRSNGMAPRASLTTVGALQ